MKSTMRVLMPFGGSLYTKYLNKKFPNIEVVDKFKGRIDLVLFTGGADVSPELYNEDKGKYTDVNPERDAAEKEIHNQSKNLGIPMLGICRGAQFLCVMAGAKLIQHVTGHALSGTHKITIAKNEDEISIPSTHHQMMYPFSINSYNYELLAYSTNFLSNIYLNGQNENLSVTEEFLEPEIVFFPGDRSLAIQGHPEMSHCSKETVDYTLNLINTYLNLNEFTDEK